MEVAAVVGHVLGPVLALGGVAAVAAVSLLIAEAARGREGHHPILVHGYPSIGVSLVKSSQLFICIWHDIGIEKSFFQVVQISPPYRVFINDIQHRNVDFRPHVDFLQSWH